MATLRGLKSQTYDKIRPALMRQSVHYESAGANSYLCPKYLWVRANTFTGNLQVVNAQNLDGLQHKVN